MPACGGGRVWSCIQGCPRALAGSREGEDHFPCEVPAGQGPFSL